MTEKKHVGILHLKWKQLNWKERNFTPALLLRFWTNKQHSQRTQDQMPSRLRKRITIAVPLYPLEGGRANRHTASRDAGKKSCPQK